jgi:hypothetical protein
MRRVALPFAWIAPALVALAVTASCAGGDVEVHDGRLVAAIDEPECATARSFCQQKVACARSAPGADLATVCAVQWLGGQRSLRANDEAECSTFADAKQAYDACTAQLSCDDFNTNDHNGQCATQRTAYVNAFGSIGASCTVAD